jgi:hypothetical protein
MSDLRHEHQAPAHGDHERTDIDPRAIWLFYSGMAVMVIGMALFVVWMFDEFLAASRRADPAPSPVAHFEQPPLPRLQVNEIADVRALRAADEERLDSFGWVSQEQKIVHVPIARAVEQLVKHGPPNWPPVKIEPPPKAEEKAKEGKAEEKAKDDKAKDGKAKEDKAKSDNAKTGDKTKTDGKAKTDDSGKADDAKADDAKAESGKERP